MNSERVSVVIGQRGNAWMVTIGENGTFWHQNFNDEIAAMKFKESEEKRLGMTQSVLATLVSQILNRQSSA